MATPPDFTAGQVLTAAQMNQIGLWHISRTTIGSAVASVTVSDAFSADFDNYKIVISGGAASTNVNLQLQLGATTTGYYSALTFVTYANVSGSSGSNNGSQFAFAGNGTTKGLTADITLFDPFATARTGLVANSARMETTGNSGHTAGFQDSATSFTAFTVLTNTGTMTGGYIDVYGFRGP